MKRVGVAIAALLCAAGLLYAGQNFGGVSFSDGSVTGQTSTVENSTAGSGAPNVLTAAESGKVIGNSGSAAEAYNTLPSAAAGLTFTFLVNDDDQDMRVTAASGDTIEIYGAVSSAAGYVVSDMSSHPCVGTLTLTAQDDTKWVATNVFGLWKVYDGAAANHATCLHGGFYITNANKAASAAISAGTPVKIGGTATADPDLAGFTVTTSSGGRLTYDGGATRDFIVNVAMGFTSSQSNEIALLYIAKNGTALTSTEIRRKLGTGSDVGALALQAHVSLATDDYLEVYVDLAASSSDTITAENVQLVASVIGN